MLAMLGSVLVVVVLLLVASVLAAACTVLPFVKAVDMAERRGFSTGRWGALAFALLVLGGLVAYVGWKHEWLLLLPALLLFWATPLVLSLLSREDGPFGGYQGAHEG